MRMRSRRRAEEGSIMVVLVLVDRGGMEVVQGGVRGIGMIAIGGPRPSCRNGRHQEGRERSYVYLWLVEYWLVFI